MNRSKPILLLLLISIIINAIILGQYIRFLKPENTGSFNTNTGIILCKKEKSCFHEVGHWKDRHLNYPSQTKEFEIAIQDYFLYCNPLNEFCMVQNKYDNNEYAEIYAEIYAIHHKELIQLPTKLYKFYIDQE